MLGAWPKVANRRMSEEHASLSILDYDNHTSSLLIRASLYARHLLRCSRSRQPDGATVAVPAYHYRRY